MRNVAIVILGILLVSCTQKQPSKLISSDAPMRYSESVQDSFRIYSSSPNDSARHPLIILLDANAYFEPVVAEYKLGKLTQGYPEAIIVGIGYKDFYTLDSLRTRDYTFPVAFPQDSFAISGGGDRFKKFIDNELIPDIKKQYRIDENNITLMGHSLGGYFVLYHMIESISEEKYPITNYISASPSLHYNDYHLLNELNELTSVQPPIKLYSSMGSMEFDLATENKFMVYESKMESLSKKNRVEAFFNFDHMDAAMPGFMKGLTFVLVEE